jgi:murein DD-endopeptidase MepM/ murein hydrolase activator NlpD
MRLGELQAQMLRLDSLGERLAQSAGLKPQELKALEAEPARGGAESSRVPARNLTLLEFTEMLDRLARQVDARTDQLNVLEALLLQNTTSQRFLPTLRPILDGWFSSNFGFRIDPFTGQRAYHDGIDFPAERGTPIQAAASGKVVFAGTQPEYGKMVDIDHGNGLVTRYAHASRLLVKEGDVVVAGQPIAAVGSTGRSTGPHLHFEVRQNGAPQNPARFLHAAR